jgi:adenylate cyclase
VASELGERKLAAILVSDIVGYSRLAGANEDLTLARLRALRSDLIDPIVSVHRGRIVKRTGDGAFVEFRSVVDAVRCAIEAQNGIIERNVGVPPEQRIEFRIGIHLGDVVEESDGDLMGDGVNIAARLEGICPPNGVCLSEDAYRQVRSRLDLAVTDLGDQTLKNIAEPVRVYTIEVGKPAQAKAAVAVAPEKAGPPRLSIVVLPFANIGGDPEQEYFVDGVTESLTTDLSRISGSFVIARNTAFTYKGKPVDVRQIGRELNVRYVLEGSVQRGGNRLRVNVQLVDAETGNHLWAERFDKPLADLFDMQDEVVARLANALGVELIRAEARRSGRTVNPDSVDLTMRGLALFWGAPKRENQPLIHKLFDEAMALDPNNDDALAASAEAYLRDLTFGWIDPRVDYHGVILGQADRALAINSNNPWAYSAKAYYLANSGHPEEALTLANAGLAANPNFGPLHFVHAYSAQTAGHYNEARADLIGLLKLSPRDPQLTIIFGILGSVEVALGDYSAAIEHERKSIELAPPTFRQFTDLAAAQALAGKSEEAAASLEAARQRNPKLTLKWLRANAVGMTSPNEIEGLRKAGLPEE